jgi:hypothetical protein
LSVVQHFRRPGACPEPALFMAVPTASRGCPQSRGVFATTRPDNAAMIGILLALGFERVGAPFSHPRRGEELVLFPWRTSGTSR